MIKVLRNFFPCDENSCLRLWLCVHARVPAGVYRFIYILIWVSSIRYYLFTFRQSFRFYNYSWDTASRQLDNPQIIDSYDTASRQLDNPQIIDSYDTASRQIDNPQIIDSYDTASRQLDNPQIIDSYDTSFRQLANPLIKDSYDTAYRQLDNTQI